MKKRLVVSLAAVLVLSLAACCGASGELSGTYVDDSGTWSYTFSGDKVTVDLDGFILEGTFDTTGGILTFNMDEDVPFVPAPAPYSIDGDKLILDGGATILTRR